MCIFWYSKLNLSDFGENCDLWASICGARRCAESTAYGAPRFEAPHLINFHQNLSHCMDSTSLKKYLEDVGVIKLAQQLISEFSNAEIFLVGGSVRDAFLGREIKDIDLVVRNVSANDLEHFLSQHGKVDLVGKSFGVIKFAFATDDPNVFSHVIDIALPRTDHSFHTGGYHDFRIDADPSLSMKKDMERRDFTINAMALNLMTDELIDIFGGQEDIAKGIIQTVGTPQDRFSEDSTRMMRAIRFASQLGFVIEEKTLAEIRKKTDKLSVVSVERIADEISKIIMSEHAEDSFRFMEKIGVLAVLFPELYEGVGVSQNKNHVYTVFEHNIRSLGFAVKRNYSFIVRLASLFHDVGKPRTKKGDGYSCTFHNHDYVGGRMVNKILQRYKYPNEVIRRVTHLVRHHMFYYSLGEVTDAGVRRLVVRLGRENLPDFIQLRMCDRLGMGRPKGKPYKLLDLERRLQTVQFDPLAPKMLALKGDDVMQILGIAPGPRVGLLTKALLADVLDDPLRNTREYLKPRLRALGTMSDEELLNLQPDIEKHESRRKQDFLKKYKEVD